MVRRDLVVLPDAKLYFFQHSAGGFRPLAVMEVATISAGFQCDLECLDGTVEKFQGVFITDRLCTAYADGKTNPAVVKRQRTVRDGLAQPFGNGYQVVNPST